MSELSITRAWSEGTEFLRREFGSVFLIAFLLICLPGAALPYVVPAAAAPDPATLDEAFAQLRQILLFLPVMIVLAMVGSIAISHLAIVPGRSVGEALGVGWRRFFTLLFAGILVGMVMTLAFLPLLLLIAPTGTQAPPALMLLLGLLYLVGFIFVSIRLLLITPVVAAESAGPVDLLLRSWALTRGHFWKLFGFAVLYTIAATVVVMVITLMIGLVLALTLGSPLEPGGAAFFGFNLMSAALQTVTGLLFSVTVARVYTQLTGAVDREIFA